MKRTALILSVALLSSGALAFAANSGRDESGVSAVATPTPTPVPTTAAVPAATPPAAQPKPTIERLDGGDDVIRIDTELVNMSVRVVDRSGHPINNLPEKDFRVTEDGQPQEITFFDKSEVPTNYALVVDNSGSMRQQLEKVIDAGKVLVADNRKDDESMIIRFVGRDKISVEQPFTPNKSDLNDALDNLFIEGGQTAIIDAVYLAVQNVEEYERSNKLDDRRRRALILVSDGEDRNSYYNEKQLFDLLQESDVQIYVIGFIDELSKDGGFIGKSPQGKSKAFLQRMADQTGGKAYFPATTNELPTIAKEISTELRTQYSIGYVPTNGKHDGTFRSIKVAVADGPDNQRRIAIAKAGRTAEGNTPGTAPASGTAAKKPN